MSDKPSPLQSGLVAAMRKAISKNPADAGRFNPLIERMGGEAVETGSPEKTYVAVDSARVFGKENKRQLVEGNLYIRNDDGTLRPIKGDELARFSDLYPEFAKNWRIGQEGEE